MGISILDKNLPALLAKCLSVAKVDFTGIFLNYIYRFLVISATCKQDDKFSIHLLEPRPVKLNLNE